MSLASRIVNRLRRSVRRRAKNALDVVESWLLQAPRATSGNAQPAPLVSPGAAPERVAAPEAPEPDLVTEETEERLAEVHTLPTPEPVGLQYAMVEELLDDMVRPALQMDGGDIKLVRVEPEGDVFVELKGACTTCPSATITMRNGIERLMADQLPGFRSLVEVHGIGNGDAAAGPG
ncbi:MAG: NifU family protein [Myxococcota bacterium]